MQAAVAGHARNSAETDLAALWNSTIQSLLSTQSSWDTATAFLAPKSIQESSGELDPDETVIRAVNELQNHGRVEELLEWHTLQVTDRFNDVIKPEIRAHFENPEARLDALLIRLATYLQLWSQPYDALPSASTSSPSSSPAMLFRRHFISLLFPLITRKDFVDSLRAFLKSTFELSQDSEASQSPEAADILRGVQAIHYLSLFERFEPVLFSLVYSIIEEKIASSSAGDLETSNQLASLGDWLTSSIGEWLISLYALAFSEAAEDAARARATRILKPTMQRFEYHIYSVLFKMRTSELFDIIVDFPNSLPAIQDLQTCLAKVDQKNYLVRSLCRQIKKRLLHPGADTKDILTSYINLIKVLKVLDGSNVLLARAAGEIREYLRNRSLTIRCIVQGLIEEDGELLNELRGGGDGTGDDENALSTAQELKEREEEAVEDYSDEGYKWVPAPVDAPPSYASTKRADIIQLLVSIYDTKELFIKELQHLLANRLLQIKNYESEKELRNIEILKIRFGEQALAGLEVMLKDLADSKRIDTSLHSSSTKFPGTTSVATQALVAPLHSTIISHLFWPALPKKEELGGMKLPGQLKSITEGYEKLYRKLKPDKRLIWIPHLGTVTVEVQLKDRMVELEVSPLQAALLELFAEKAEHTVSGLAETLRLADLDPVKGALQFWQTKGVLAPLPLPPGAPIEEGSARWAVCETRQEALPGPHEISKAEQRSRASIAKFDANPPTAILGPEEIENLKTFFPFITNILTNLHAMPTQRLHSMLKAVAPGFGDKAYSVDKLEIFLLLAKREGALGRKTGGDWVLPNR